MKKIITLSIVLASFGIHAQDTTSWRAVGATINDAFAFFNDDRTDLTSVSIPTSVGPGHAIFMNPKDSLLYYLQGDWSANRELFSLNPFSGAVTLVNDISATYLSTMDISEDGNTLYAIQGQGAISGTIYAINTNTWVETVIGAFVSTGNSSFGVEYHPADSSLYAYEGSWSGFNNLQTFNLATSGLTSTPLTGFTDNQIHGALFSGTDGIFSVYTGQDYTNYDSDVTSSNLTLYNNTNTATTNDIEVMWTLRRAADVMTVCPNTTDSAMISLIYDVPVFSWYKDGVVLPLTNDTIMVFDAGIYQALYQIDAMSYMWSEPIEIVVGTIPVVNISQTLNDTLICPGDTIMLSGASGGTLQWYLDGSPIVGANANAYGATVAGSYNQMKTNASGCIDTAMVAFVIYSDTDCGAGLGNENIYFSVYPNPIQEKLQIESSAEIISIRIVDISGKEIFIKEDVHELDLSIDFTSMDTGLYILNIETVLGDGMYKIMK